MRREHIGTQQPPLDGTREFRLFLPIHGVLFFIFLPVDAMVH